MDIPDITNSKIIGKAFEVKTFDEKNFKNSLENEHILKDKFTSKILSKHYNYLLGYLKELRCKSIIIENNYVDRDFLIDFSKYYVRCFKDYERLCKRIHLFRKEYKDKSSFLEDFLNHEKELKNNYLGFIVAKPLPDAIIGRTILDTYSADGTGRNFTCLRDYDINLFGLKIKKNSLAYQEQDTATAACATSALWSTFQKTSKLFNGSISPPPIEITNLATKYQIQSRPIPSTGLNTGQMCQAIKEVGLTSHVVDIEEDKDWVPLQTLIYSYLHFGIPVIIGGEFDGLGTGNHAITLTGYHLKDKPHVEREIPEKSNSTYYNLIGRRIDKFYAHDDQLGPFCKLEIDKNFNNYPVNFSSVTYDGTKIWEKINLIVIIVPLYEKIRVVFNNIYGFIRKLNLFMYNCNIIEKKNTEWDIHLVELNDYKEKLYKNKNFDSYNFETLFERLPRFLWRCILTENGNPVMEFICDATDMKRSFFVLDIFLFKDDFKERFKEKIENEEIMELYSKKISSRFIKLIKEKV